jgi:hypothetical protein
LRLERISSSYFAETGEKAWWVRGLSWQPKSSPVVEGDMIYMSTWETSGDVAAPPQIPTFAEMLAKYDKNHDSKLSSDELAEDLKLQKSLWGIDLDKDGLLDAREWNQYRAVNSARNSLVAVRRGGQGDVTATNVVWSMEKFLPNCPSPLIYEGVMYLVKDGGILTALDPKTGKLLKQGRLTGALNTYYASPVAACGKVFLVSQQGKATVVKAGRDWELLAVNDLDDEAYATPAIFDNKLYLRTRSALYCFSDRK